MSGRLGMVASCEVGDGEAGAKANVRVWQSSWWCAIESEGVGVDVGVTSGVDMIAGKTCVEVGDAGVGVIIVSESWSRPDVDVGGCERVCVLIG